MFRRRSELGRILDSAITGFFRVKIHDSTLLVSPTSKSYNMVIIKTSLIIDYVVIMP